VRAFPALERFFDKKGKDDAVTVPAE